MADIQIVRFLDRRFFTSSLFQAFRAGALLRIRLLVLGDRFEVSPFIQLKLLKHLNDGTTLCSFQFVIRCEPEPAPKAKVGWRDRNRFRVTQRVAL